MQSVAQGFSGDDGGTAKWKIQSTFDEIHVFESSFKVFFPALKFVVDVCVAEKIIDLCATDNFVVVATDEHIFIAHKNELAAPLRSVYGRGDTPTFEFKPFFWTSTILPFNDQFIFHKWLRRKALSDVLLTATSSTIYMILNTEGVSMCLRLFNEGSYLLDNMVKPTVVQIPQDVLIVMTASGYDHSLFLTSEGAMYALGTGSRGELGIGLVPRVCEFSWLEALEGINVVSIAAAGWHSAALTDDGDVYVWGWNHRNQLGDKKEKVEFYPSPLDICIKIVDISLGAHFTALWICEDEEEPSIIMGRKKIGMPSICLTYYSEAVPRQNGKPLFHDDHREPSLVIEL